MQTRQIAESDAGQQLANDTLTTFYDISLSPYSFDYFTFLALSDLERRRAGKQFIHLVIVPKTGVEEISREDLDLGVEVREKGWRLYSMLTAGAWIVPAMSKVTVCNDRHQAQMLFDHAKGAIFPATHTLDKPVMGWDKGHAVWHAALGEDMQSFAAPASSKSMMEQWLAPRAKGRKSIAITLREATYFPKRNSNLAEWSKFAKAIEEEGYHCVFFRDAAAISDTPPPELESFTTFPQAIFCLELRVALYELCHFCLFVSNGPAETAFYNKNIDYLYFVTGNWLNDKPSPFEGQGIGFGTTPPFATESQKWVWKEHTAELIKQEFDAMDAKIEKRNKHSGQISSTPRRVYSTDELYEIGRCFDRSNQYVDAVMSYEHVVEQDPKNGNAFLRLASVRIKGAHYLGDLDLDQCAEDLRHAKKNGVDSPVEIHIEMGKLFMAGGQWAEAIEAYDKILAERPDFPPVLIQKAIAYDEMGSHQEAIDAYQSLIEVGQDHPNILYRIMQNLKAMGRFSEATQIGLEWHKMNF